MTNETAPIYDIIYPLPASRVGELVDFLQKYWKKKHIFVLSREMLDFQHYDIQTDSYNFVVAHNNITGEIDALAGVIPVSLYDSALAEQKDYWGGIWKKRDDVHNKEIGIAAFEVYDKLYHIEPGQQSFGSFGMSSAAKKMDILYRNKMGYLRQYYILNNRIKEFRIADGIDIIQLAKPIVDTSTENYTLNITDQIDWENCPIKGYYRPLKSPKFFKNRFSLHPFYHYYFIEILHENRIETILACRIIEANGARCIRIVDILGKFPETNLKQAFLEILYRYNAEYIDILNYGIDSSVFQVLGFSELNFDGDTIIPNYFEPFERKNVKLENAYKAKYDNFTVFKADDDQDRPNIIP